jgi:hypothetical protein
MHALSCFTPCQWFDSLKTSSSNNLTQLEEFSGSVDEGVGGDLEDGRAFVDALDQGGRVHRLGRVQRLQIRQRPLQGLQSELSPFLFVTDREKKS